MMSDSQLISKNVPSMCVMLFFIWIIKSEYLHEYSPEGVKADQNILDQNSENQSYTQFPSL